jgi:ATP-dependent DNA helicase RecG
LTDEVLAELWVSDRQIIIIRFVKEKGKITSSDILKLMAVSRQSAYRDLADLVHRRVLEKKGESRKGSYYVFAKNSGNDQDNSG